MNINIIDFQSYLSKIARQTIIPSMEWKDVLQELNLHFLMVQHKYDPLKSQPKTFITRVATNKIRDLARRSAAKKRNYKNIVSLDALIEDGFDIAYDQYGKTLLQNN